VCAGATPGFAQRVVEAKIVQFPGEKCILVLGKEALKGLNMKPLVGFVIHMERVAKKMDISTWRKSDWTAYSKVTIDCIWFVSAVASI
jgi:hypothetical protein